MNMKMKKIIQDVLDNLKGFEQDIKNLGKEYYEYDRYDFLKSPFFDQEEEDQYSVDIQTITVLLIQLYLFNTIQMTKEK
tara:strand:+ start:180 stop:416 length:237 start_codon:yes stop_codon:yes gene_type:complete